ncbi:MAG: SIMPL domain-containing protein [Limisphaerales bacterium]
MKPNRITVLVASLAITSTVSAQLNPLAGVTEATTALIEASKVVTLAGDATLRVSADRAVVKISVGVEAKALADGSEKNRKLREALTQALVKQGIPEDRIRSARFSSTPQTGMFSSKVKGYRVENQMRITVESEAEFQAVAAQIDARPEMTYLGLEPIDSKEVENKAAVLAQACEGINRKKAAVEQALKVKLAPARLAEGGSYYPFPQQPRAVGFDWAGPSAAGSRADSDFRFMIRTLEQRGDDGSGFGEKTYRAVVAAEFQIVK